MRAVVLAAGRGARMRPLSDTTHKSLLTMGEGAGGDPILARIVDGLLALGVADITIVTGHLREQVEAFLAQRYPDLAFRLVHNPRHRETNNIVSLALAFEAMPLDQDVALIECDVLFQPHVLSALADPEPGNLALVDRFRPGMDGTVVSVADGIVTQVFPPHLQTEDFDYRDKWKTVNIYRFDHRFCRETFQPLLSCYAHAIDGGSYYELVLGMLINLGRQRVRAVAVDPAAWAEVDDPNDWAAARFAFQPAERARILGTALGGHWNFDVLDFSFMRNQYFPPDAMIAAMRRGLPGLLRSYGSAQTVADQKLAYALACSPQRLLCLNGGAQAYPWLADLFAERTALLPRPTFQEYPRWFPRHRTYADAVGVDWDALEADTRAGELVVVVNPNNPTGTTADTARLHAWMARHPQTDFLVDESFVAFSAQPSLLDRLETAPLDNVLVLASLSKCWGIPGARLGYVYAARPAWLDFLRARVPIWNLNSMAEFFLELVLKFRTELDDSYARTAADRDHFRQGLAQLCGVAEVYPSGGDFLLVRLAPAAPPAATVVHRLLASDRIYLKDVSPKFADGPEGQVWLRLAVRRPAENERLLAALPAALRPLP